ncbi:MAG: chemotaxis protein CheW [Polyangiales bacterium]
MNTHPPSELLEAIATKERELDVLRRRLAAFREAIRLPAGRVGVLRCRLGGSHVAFREDEIDEVVAMAELLVLPNSPAWLMGLLTVGRVRIPVLDLVARDTGVRRTADPSEHVVLATVAGRRLGVVVDELESLDTLEGSDVARPSADLPFAAHVVGVADVGERPTLLLSMEPLVAELPLVEGAG